jgi:hypothetical protein
MLKSLSVVSGGSVGGCVATLIAPAFLSYYIIGNAEANPCIDTPSSLTVLGVVLQGVDFIAEKPGPLLSGVRDERFSARKFQLEMIAQVVLELVLDRLGFRLRADKTKSGSQGTLLSLSPLRTGLVPLKTSGSSTSRTTWLLVLYQP